MASRYAEIVRDDMSERDPDNADYYAANYDAFAEVIDELDAAMRDGVRHGRRNASCSPTTTPTPTSPRSTAGR